MVGNQGHDPIRTQCCRRSGSADHLGDERREEGHRPQATQRLFGFGTGTALSIDEPKAPVEAETALASAQALVAEAKAEVTEAEAKQVSEPEKEPEKEPEPAPEPAAEPAEAKPAETESEKQKGQTKLIVDALIARLEKGVVSYEKAVDWLQSQAANFTPDELSFALGRLAMLQMQQLKQ